MTPTVKLSRKGWWNNTCTFYMMPNRFARSCEQPENQQKSELYILYPVWQQSFHSSVRKVLSEFYQRQYWPGNFDIPLMNTVQRQNWNLCAGPPSQKIFLRDSSTTKSTPMLCAFQSYFSITYALEEQLSL